MVGKKQVRGAKETRPRWPCSVCAKDCITDSIFCRHCGKWLHSTCDNVSESQLQELSSIPCGYICTACCSHPIGGFDFTRSLARMRKASRANGMKGLRQAAVLEKILLRNQPLELSTKKNAASQGIKVHQYSESIINSRGAASRVPLNVKGDGNCLFNSVSVAIRGDQTMSWELRVRTCIELVLNCGYYRNHFQFQNFKLVSCDLEEACQDCAIDGEFSSIFTMQALASVVGREIVSVYPAINGMLDKCISILNTILQPRIPGSRNRFKERIYIMWTRLSGTLPRQRNTHWLPNHFVPLVEQDIEPPVYEINSDGKLQSFQSGIHSPGSTSKYDQQYSIPLPCLNRLVTTNF